MLLSRKQSNVLFVILATIALAGVISLTLTAWWFRLDAGFIGRWLRAWLVGSLVAAPSGLLVFPFLRRLADRLQH